jgi:hypothetical protein
VFFVSFPLGRGWRKIPCLPIPDYSTCLLATLRCNTRQRKEQLISQMSSTIRDISIPAVEELRRNNWLEDGSLRGAKLFEANLEGAELGRANLEGVSFYGCNLKGAYITEANLQKTDFSAANLEGAYLGFSNFHGALFMAANLRKASLTEANLESANLSHADMREAKLYKANFTKAKLSNTNLAKITWFDGANFQEAIYDHRTIWPDGFDPVAAGAILVEDEDEAKSGD